MTFQELSWTLPNGFHDAELQRFEMDYLTRTLRLDVVVWIGDMDDAPRREMYRPARVTVKSVAYFIIEPPDPKYDWAKPGRVRIDTGEDPESHSDTILPPTPEGTTANWMFINDFNRCLYFAAGESSLEWTGEENNRT